MSRRITPAESEKGLPRVGDVLAGKYQVERALGAGGMGVVFEVMHVITGKRFAIKWMLRDRIEDEQGVRRFIREAQIASRIDHPNVVQVYDVHQDAAGVFLVMELLEGRSLAELLCSQGRLAPREAVRIMLASMEGLVAAHAAGVVHRDIKPANIFLCKARPGALEQPKVLDFGISRLTNVQDTLGYATTQSGATTGTPYYMAPEQMLPGPVDARVDVYALGVSLYELLAGQRPYDGSTLAELVVKISLGEAVPLDQVAPDVPAALSALVARAMHRVASERFESVEACRQALQRMAAEWESRALPLSTAAPARPPRPRVWLWSVLAVMLAALLGASATWWSLRREDWLVAPAAVTHTAETVTHALRAVPAEPQVAPAPLPAAPPAGQATPPLQAAPPAASAGDVNLTTDAIERERQVMPASRPPPSAASPKPTQLGRGSARPQAPKVSEPAPSQPEPATPSTSRQRPTLSLDRDGF